MYIPRYHCDHPTLKPQIGRSATNISGCASWLPRNCCAGRSAGDFLPRICQEQATRQWTFIWAARMSGACPNHEIPVPMVRSLWWVPDVLVPKETLDGRVYGQRLDLSIPIW